MTENNDTVPQGTNDHDNVFSRLGLVGTVVDERISQWQNGLRHPNPRRQALSVAILARLRRGVGKDAGSVPDILPYTLADAFASKDAPDQPTRKEIAAHIAMTLYSVHQQSQKQPMHKRGQGLGRAIRRLHPEEPTIPPKPVVRRFQALVTADTLGELVHHARGIVQLLRTEGFPLDYGQLADQLVKWQNGGASAVRMVWARDFYRTRVTDTSDGSPGPAVSIAPEGKN